MRTPTLTLTFLILLLPLTAYSSEEFHPEAEVKITIPFGKSYNYESIKGDIQVYFSPNGGCQEAIVEQVNGAKSEILVAMYALTEGDISWALVKAKERGIDVKVVLDQAQKTQKYAKGRFLSKKGVPVRYEDRSGLLHHKFAVIDNKIAITGSFNWTASAESRNNENLLVITSAELAKKYKEEFLKLWEAGEQAE